MSSRLARDRTGRLIVVLTMPQPGCTAGDRFVALGNTFEAGGTGVGFLGEITGRKPEPVEQPQPRPEGRVGTVRQSWPAELPGRARELHAEGLSCPKVAAELGVPFATAKSWIWPAATLKLGTAFGTGLT